MTTTANTNVETTNTTTNAASQALATSWSELDSKGKSRGRFTSLVIRKVGKVRGREDNKMRYGDDLVHTVIVTGFNYLKLVQRSLDTRRELESTPGFYSDLVAMGK